MNTTKIALSCLLLAAAVPALAGPATLLDFETQAKFDPIEGSTLNLANGAVTLSTGNVWLIGSAATLFTGSLGNFYGTKNSADPDSNRGALTLTSNPSPPPGVPRTPVSSFTISILNGFNGAFSLDFAGQGAAFVTAFDGSGNRLFTSAPKSQANCDGGYACHWSTLEFDLGSSTNVFSIVVDGVDSQQWFDNLSFANLLDTPPGRVPEPGGVALSLAAIGALAWTRKRMTLARLCQLHAGFRSLPTASPCRHWISVLRRNVVP